jgi:hypothetical protein
MILNKLTLKDKVKFDQYLRLRGHALSVYSFANIYIWRKFFEIRWFIVEGSLCVIFKDKIGSFLYLAPLAKNNKPEVIFYIFKLLKRLNKNPELAHLENIEEGDLGFYRKLGFECSLKSQDYILSREELSGLRGNKYKSKRAGYNYFTKNFDFLYQELNFKDRQECLALYSLWAQERKAGNNDSIYQGMLEDSHIALKEALDNYTKLGFKGAKVQVDKVMKAFTFGFALNQETFCILYEIADLNIKGLAQFIFSSFARELKDYKYINIMDDSGLPNLKRVKFSYHPKRLAQAYTVRIKND